LLTQLDSSTIIYILERDYLLTVGKNNFIGTPKRTERFPSGIKQGLINLPKKIPRNTFCLSCPFSPKTKEEKCMYLFFKYSRDQSRNHLPGFLISIQNIIVLRPLPF